MSVTVSRGNLSSVFCKNYFLRDRYSPRKERVRKTEKGREKQSLCVCVCPVCVCVSCTNRSNPQIVIKYPS